MPHPLTRIAATLIAAAAIPFPAIAAGVDYSQQLDEQGLRSVHAFLEHKDCPGAVKALNKGVADKQRAVLLLAGSMFEQGICVKQDWTRAAHFYQRAHEAGSKSAMPRLISGYAEQNRDPAAALWWMAKTRANLPQACTVANHLADNPDAFVAALNAWPAGKIDACVYTGGVLQRLIGDIEFPGAGAVAGVSGDANLVFVPSAGTLTWTSGNVERIAVTRRVEHGETDSVVFKDAFLGHVRSIGARTLTQFKKPDGIDPAWTISMKFSFKYQ